MKRMRKDYAMKKVASVLLTIVLLVTIAGCGETDMSSDVQGSHTGPTDNSAHVAGTSNPSTAGTGAPSTSGTNAIVDPGAPTKPENPGNSLIDYDPERDIYFFSDAHDYTIYRGKTSVSKYAMYIISKEELDLESMDLIIPVEASYKIIKQQVELQGLPAADSNAKRNQFPYELYLCYIGKNFTKLTELKEAANAAYAAAFDSDLPAEDFFAAYEAYEEAASAYENFYHAEMPAYQKLTGADLPKFYLYHIGAQFLGEFANDEEFTQVQVIVDGECYDLPVGNIRLRTEIELPASLDWYRGDYTYATNGIIGSGNATAPYNDGIHRVYSYFSFPVKEYMRLTDLILENPNQKLEKVWIDLVTYDGMNYTGEWDLSQPLELYEGDQIRIDIAYRQESAAQLSYSTKVWGYLVYDCDDGTFCKLSECDITTSINYYEMYAIIFDGLDLESYYRDYYYPVNEPWRQEIGG